MANKWTWLFRALVLLYFVLAISDASHRDIKAMKSLLQKLFKNYNTEMSKLRGSLKSSRNKVKNLERAFEQRAFHLESMISDLVNANQTSSKHPRNAGSYDRIFKLEELSKTYGE